jgi:hypothetical protein
MDTGSAEPNKVLPGQMTIDHFVYPKTIEREREGLANEFETLEKVFITFDCPK